MPRADGRIDAGESLDNAISARAWNRAQDAADIVLGQKRVGGSLEFGGAPYIALPCKATNDLERWDAVEITGLAVLPDAGTNALRSFESLPCLTGRTPEGASPKFGIAVEPIKSGQIGRVAVAGVVQATIKVASANPTTAGIKEGESTLVAGASGASVIYVETGTGNKLGLIRFGAGAGLRLCKTSAAFDKGTIATLNVWEDGTPPSETETIGSQIEGVINKYADIKAGKFCSVATHGNGKWYVVAAECDG